MPLQAVVAMPRLGRVAQPGHIPDQNLEALSQGTDGVVPGGAVGAGTVGQDDDGRAGRTVPFDVQVSAVGSGQTDL